MKNFVCKIPMLIIALTFIGCGGLGYLDKSCMEKASQGELHNEIKISLVSHYTSKKLAGPGTCRAGKISYKKFTQCLLEKYYSREKYEQELKELKNFIAQVDKIPLVYGAMHMYGTGGLNCSVIAMRADYDNNVSVVYEKGYDEIVNFYISDQTPDKTEIYEKNIFNNIIENIHNDIIAYNNGLGLWIKGKRQGKCKDGKHKYGDYSYACENGLIKDGLIRVIQGEPLITTVNTFYLKSYREININQGYLYQVIKITDYGDSREIKYYDLTELFKTIRQNADAKLENSLKVIRQATEAKRQADRQASEAKRQAYKQGYAAYKAVEDFTSGRTKTRPSQATINLASRFEKKYLKGSGSDTSSQTFDAQFNAQLDAQIEKDRNDRDVQIKSEVTMLEKQLSEDEYLLKLIKTQEPKFTRMCEYKVSQCQISFEKLVKFNKYEKVKGWSVK